MKLLFFSSRSTVGTRAPRNQLPARISAMNQQRIEKYALYICCCHSTKSASVSWPFAFRLEASRCTGVNIKHRTARSCTYYSVTSSRTISRSEVIKSSALSISRHLLTKSSKPSRTPVNSRSFFMITQIRDPMHLSTSSNALVEQVVAPGLEITYREAEFGTPSRRGGGFGQ